MKLYHGSKYLFNEIDLSKCKKGKDFGRGFYLTTNRNQAVKWATRNNGNGYLYVYEFDESNLEDTNLSIKQLLKYNKQWADYVCRCRIELYESGDDIVYDKMADSTFFVLTAALEKYYYQQITLEQLLFIARFSNGKYDQYCFKTEEACKLLEFKEVETV